MTSPSDKASSPLCTYTTESVISPNSMLKKRPLHDITNQNMKDNNTSTPIKRKKQSSSDTDITGSNRSSSFINFTANNISDASTQYYSSRKILNPQTTHIKNPRSLSVVPVESLLLPDDQSPTSGSISPNLFQLHRGKDNDKEIQEEKEKNKEGDKNLDVNMVSPQPKLLSHEIVSKKSPNSDSVIVSEPKKDLQLPYHVGNSGFERTVDPSCSVFSAVDPKSGIQLSMMSFNTPDENISSISSSSKLEQLPDTTTSFIEGDGTIDEFITISSNRSKKPLKSTSIRGHYKIQSLFAKAKHVQISNLPEIQVPQSVFSSSLKAFLSHISAHKYHFKQYINQYTLHAATNTMDELFKSHRKTIFKLTISQLVQLLLLYRHAFRITRYEKLKMYLYCGCGKTISCGMKFCLAFDTSLQLGFIWKTSNDLGVSPFGHGVEDISHLCDLKTFGLDSIKANDLSNFKFATNNFLEKHPSKKTNENISNNVNAIPMLPNLQHQLNHMKLRSNKPIPDSSTVVSSNNNDINQLTIQEKQRLILIFNQALHNPGSFPVDCQLEIKNMVNCSKALFEKWHPHEV